MVKAGAGAKAQPAVGKAPAAAKDAGKPLKGGVDKHKEKAAAPAAATGAKADKGGKPAAKGSEIDDIFSMGKKAAKGEEVEVGEDMTDEMKAIAEKIKKAREEKQKKEAAKVSNHTSSTLPCLPANIDSSLHETRQWEFAMQLVMGCRALCSRQTMSTSQTICMCMHVYG